MSLSYRQKSAFYRELGQLLRAGKPFPASIQLLQGATSGPVRTLLTQLKTAVDGGASVGDAFTAQYPLVSHLEASIIGAGGRTGKLDQSCAYLSEYYSGLEAARKSVVRQLLYPLFVLHFAALINGLPALVLGGGIVPYLKGSLGVLVLIYLCCFAFWLLVRMILFEGARNISVDRLLRMMPVYGKMRRSFALARFCATYEMQLQSGVNVMDSLASAAKSAQGALINEAVKKAIPLVRAGAQVGPLLAGSGAFTEEMVRTLQIGEETGSLDAELKRMSHTFQAEGMAQLDLLGAIFAKAIYFAVVGYAVYLIFKIYSGYLGEIDKIGI